MANLGKIGAGIALGIALLGANSAPHLTRRTYTATVTEKVVKRYDKSDKYIIFTKLSEGNIRVFQNTDSLLELKFRSSDLQAKIETGKSYEIETYGWRIPLFSWYENILNVRENK